MEVIRGRCLLQFWLDHREMTQAQFAERTGWSKRIVSYFATGQRPMNPEAMYLAAMILNIQMEQLYEWEIVTK
ncbi:helix-turn-helix transcriptional regulator [Paenibacillus xylanexedens]|uniref:helix-turn-helix domain-containing protein n=1 Tax=Paenibacillus xylanexedens TaxID=528191 RepID=UPI0028EC1DE7|nr:helix-turn-helix transcriptional regulator [Paenibacillus xylanexedens]